MWFWPASSLIYGNKMPTRCNRGFYCRSYCLRSAIKTSFASSWHFISTSLYFQFSNLSELRTGLFLQTAVLILCVITSFPSSGRPYFRPTAGRRRFTRPSVFTLSMTMMGARSTNYGGWGAGGHGLDKKWGTVSFDMLSDVCAPAYELAWYNTEIYAAVWDYYFLVFYLMTLSIDTVIWLRCYISEWIRVIDRIILL